MPFSRSGETRVDKTHGDGMGQQGRKTEEYSVEMTDRALPAKGPDGTSIRMVKSQGVKMDGKIRETTVTTQARARQRQDGQSSAEGAGREDETCNTSEPANALGQEGEWTASMRNPLKGRDRRQATADAGPRPTAYETVSKHGTRTGMARLNADGQRRRNLTRQALSRRLKTRTRVGLVDDDRLRGPNATRSDSSSNGKTSYTAGKIRSATLRACKAERTTRTARHRTTRSIDSRPVRQQGRRRG
ncbi:hypothetical protein CF319_g6410 [Tilletia indica]|nr:hypothetical protein CF319_g6410 [Tilletia indica]